MIRNYFLTAWRQIVKSPFYSGLNIAGLSTGLAVGILILMWVQDETGFDQFHKKAKNIYQVNSPIGTGSLRKVWKTTQATVAPVAKREIPGILDAVRLTSNEEYTVYGYKDKIFQEPGACYTDPSFLTIFDFPLLAGDRMNPFPDDHSILITKSVAKRYFGDQEALGKVIQADHKENFTITGILADLPQNSSIHYNMFFSMGLIAKWYGPNSFWKSLDNNWGDFGYQTFLEVQPGTPLKQIGEQLIRIQAKLAPHIKVSLTEDAFQLQPLSDIHLHEADGKSPALQTVRIFLVIALLTLLIAGINYINLSTARALLRAKEVSIRKMVGAEKHQLFAQFIIESILFFLISVVLAVLFIWLLIPSYNSLSQKHFHFDLFDLTIWKVVGLAGFSTLAASSIYPALLLSSFEPLKTLKGKVRSRIGHSMFRKVLVITQFVFSTTLIIGTMVIGRQLKFIREMDPGYDRSQVFYFHARNLQSHFDALRTGLKSLSSISAFSTANGLLVNNGHTTGGADWDGKAANGMMLVHQLAIDQDFLPALKIKLVAGSNFTGSAMDSAHFILNETAVATAGIRDPVGKAFSLGETRGIIIGVAKDFNFESLKSKITPSVLYYRPDGGLVYIRTTGKDAAAAIIGVRQYWEKYNAGYPFEYHFLDEQYGKLYATDQRIGILFRIFSMIAIFISCLGLLGLATYTAQVRTKEIGIRKVLGATVTNIVSLIAGNFLRLVLLAIVIATPLAWWAMNDWLQNFAYRIQVSPWIFAIAGATVIAIALATISFQSIRAALINPVKSLKNE